ncbi:hypothetical protein M378DRAFT_18628 [Amanita muscaria Koide BX008]|uniref:Uncharacterized protein n=1 Tax=Amanita muscaria (strain Koide BX008) TaxID=946122 RepID=A0A0C2WDP4_AMAMK|nr:hypothetical protein M378DRAFT_18628 [Amanita muscaria Koide BX008]
MSDATLSDLAAPGWVLPPTPVVQLPKVLETRVNRIRKRLMASGGYLGDPNFRRNVHWVKLGNAHMVMPRVETDGGGLVPARDAAASAPVAEDGNDAPSTSAEFTETEDVMEREVAILSAVVEISGDDFYLSSDGNFQGPNRFTAGLAQVKVSCCGGIPELEPFRSDFVEVKRNVDWMLSEAATRGVHLKKGFSVGTVDAPKLKVRHALFEPRESGTVEEVGSQGSETEGTSAAVVETKWWEIENWPVQTHAALEALPGLCATHKVVAVPAYDMHGHLIHPSFYRSRLVGAVVELGFELTHWSMKAKGEEEACDTFAADLVTLRVIVPPKPVRVTPRKRRVVHKLDPLEAPTTRSGKRRAVGG